MNILGICLSPGKGGLELYAHSIISMLHEEGHNCHFALAEGQFLQSLGWRIPLIKLQPVFRKFPIQTARQLASYIDAHAIDVIHMHWNKDLNLAALAKLLSHRKPKLVYSRHMEITRPKKDFYHRFLYKQVDMVLVISNFVRKQALQYLPLASEKIQLSYLGVPRTRQSTTESCREEYPELFGDEKEFVIGMIGRIEEYKGQHLLLEAVHLLKQKNKDCKIALAGPIMDKDYFDKLQNKIRILGLSENVCYLGSIKNSGRLMACCDVVVLTTYCETFGLVLAEAMRAGTAVIGTNAGGVPEIIKDGETGLLFKPGSASELAGCLTELIQNPVKRNTMAAAGRNFADKMFDEQKHLEGLQKMFSDL